MAYEIRYFFDFGSGVCLWAKNESANQTFGYAIDHWRLPIQENTKRWLNYLISWYDISLDWENAPTKSALWSAEENERFNAAVLIGLKSLKTELPSSEFVITYEKETRNS